MCGLLKEPIFCFHFYFDRFLSEEWYITLSISNAIDFQHIYCTFAISLLRITI